MMHRQAFIIRVPGHAAYSGVFTSTQQAQRDAEQKFPNAAPATVINLTRLAAQRRAAKC